MADEEETSQAGMYSLSSGVDEETQDQQNEEKESDAHEYGEAISGLMEKKKKKDDGKK